MNKFPLGSRFIPRTFVSTSTEGRLPFRFWMSGSLAVVMAAMLPMRDLSETSRGGAMRLLRHSRFGVSETVRRIEATAQSHGLSVLARLGGERPAIVLASSVGGTLIVMDEPDSAPAMPLGLLIRADARGGADVLVQALSTLDRRHFSELPDAVVRDVAALPTLVEQALG